ncbi:MAG: iron-sulfur cluster assembly scaffold protein [bacterium]
MSPKYSPQIMEHFQNPRHQGVLEGNGLEVRVTNPVCGDFLLLKVQEEEGRIVAARFQAEGCLPTVAAGSWLCEWLHGKSREEALALRPEEMEKGLGGLPRAKKHVLALALGAVAEVFAGERPEVKTN